MTEYRKRFESYIEEPTFRPLFFCGDALEVLRAIPDEARVRGKVLGAHASCVLGFTGKAYRKP